MPIPEFILQRMLVPKSFKRSESGFAFSLLNGYAPGTITGLKLLVDGLAIPHEAITIEVEGQPAKCVTEISRETPMAFPTGVLIKVHARYASGFHSAVIEAETREAGRIHFTLWKQKVEPVRRRRWSQLFQTPVEFSLPSLNNIQPDLTLPVGLNLDTLDLRQLENLWKYHFPFLIFPAVSAASFGRRKSCEIAPATPNDPQRQTDIKDPYGAMEFTHFCQSHHTHSVNLVDTLRLDPHEAASLAKGCGSETAAVPGPEHAESPLFNAPVWVIAGNAWQEWEFSHDSARVYARKLQHYQTAMRNLSLSMKIGALGKCVLTNDTQDENFQWNQQLLDQAGNSIDLLFWQLPLLEKWVSGEPLDARSWQAIRDPLTGMIARLDHQLHGGDRQREGLQALDISRFLTSLDCQIKNHITPLDPMDLSILLLELLNALLDHTSSFAFVVLGNVSQMYDRDSMAGPVLQMILNHVTSASSLIIRRMENENILVFISRDNNQIEVTLLNRLVDRDLRLVFDREDAKALCLVNLQSVRANHNTVRKPSNRRTGISPMKLPSQSITQLKFVVNDDKSSLSKNRA